MDAPRYSYAPGVFAGLARDIVLLRRRDFRRDAQACLARLTPPLDVTGTENIPRQGRCVITVNHYHRPGFGAEWLAMAISAHVPARVRWIMTAEFTYPGAWYAPLGSAGSRVLLRRIAHVYGFIPMPPMPPRRKDVQARAASVRAVLALVKTAENPVLGLAPEGHDASQAGVLTHPPAGVGRFGLLLSRAGLPFVPVGAFELGGALHLRFGEAYDLGEPGGSSPAEKDRRASRLLMERIARLVPVHLRGGFA